MIDAIVVAEGTSVIWVNDIEGLAANWERMHFWRPASELRARGLTMVTADGLVALYIASPRKEHDGDF